MNRRNNRRDVDELVALIRKHPGLDAHLSLWLRGMGYHSQPPMTLRSGTDSLVLVTPVSIHSPIESRPDADQVAIASCLAWGGGPVNKLCVWACNIALVDGSVDMILRSSPYDSEVLASDFQVEASMQWAASVVVGFDELLRRMMLSPVPQFLRSAAKLEEARVLASLSEEDRLAMEVDELFVMEISDENRSRTSGF